MEIFKTEDEKSLAELENLLRQINNQRSIYDIHFSEAENCLEYRIVYGLTDIKTKRINISQSLMNDREVLQTIDKILTRFSLVKHKTRENINSYLTTEYIQSITKSQMPLDIVDEIDKNVLLKRIKESKDDIINYLDIEIATRVILTTLENITLTSIASLINEKLAAYLLTYTFIAPFIYTHIPHKIDTIKNKRKYNRVVSYLESKQDKRKPLLKIYCVVNKRIHELEAEDPELFEKEIKELKSILEECYENSITEEKTIDLNIIQIIEDIYSEIDIKRLRRKTLYIVDYLPSEEKRRHAK